jgi:hypothetical protein
MDTRLDHDGDATLAERATKLAGSKQSCDVRVAGLLGEFTKLDGLNNEIRRLAP